MRLGRQEGERVAQFPLHSLLSSLPAGSSDSSGFGGQEWEGWLWREGRGCYNGTWRISETHGFASLWILAVLCSR